VVASSLRAAPLTVLIALTISWLLILASGAVWVRGGPIVLTVIASMVKLVTAALITWTITHPHSPIGLHEALDWVPLGSLNAATGIWWLRVIRHQAH
jgi:hypothetical protein